MEYKVFFYTSINHIKIGYWPYLSKALRTVFKRGFKDSGADRKDLPDGAKDQGTMWREQQVDV